MYYILMFYISIVFNVCAIPNIKIKLEENPDICEVNGLKKNESKLKLCKVGLTDL